MIFYNEEGALNLDLNSRTLLPIRKPATIPVTASITGAVQKRHQYDQLSNYSTNDLDNERIEESDSNTIETSTSSPANNLDHKRIEESNTLTLKTSTSSSAIETSTLSLANVQNLSYVASKGRPSKQRYLTSAK
ncbi:hypothetical protein C2G38_2161385 [Gigaspora rosea]|uniref:Uncharacterized protein n=1 Tax=Gigaspora rosea TaxID=44941 RepID=A0A397W1E9_9GLOM|nr:hypothetical protein C2G38_2161385 [Gigaspora rosea]